MAPLPSLSRCRLSPSPGAHQGPGVGLGPLAGQEPGVGEEPEVRQEAVVELFLFPAALVGGAQSLT